MQIMLDPRASVAAEGGPNSGPDLGQVEGKKIGIRLDELWKCWEFIADEWATSLRELGAEVEVWRAPIVKEVRAAEAKKSFRSFIARNDAVISGLCNCGSCTYWAIHDALGAFGAGAPTVAVATAHFERLATFLAGQGGWTAPRLELLPYPLEGSPEDHCRAVAGEHFPSLLEKFGAVVAPQSLTTV